MPGTENAGDYDLVEVVYAYDLEGGKPIQNSCKINPKLPNGGFNLIAAGRSGDTFQFAERILAFSSNGLTLANSEYFVNFGSSTGSVAYRSTNSDYHLGVVAVLGYRNVLSFTSQ